MLGRLRLQLLEIRPLPLPLAYMALFPPLLSPVLWERSGNVPALVRLLQAYLQKAHSAIIQGNHLPAILGVFQKLAASKVTTKSHKWTGAKNGCMDSFK
jgi:exportin-2 (importin alpha re-exporter)